MSDWDEWDGDLMSLFPGFQQSPTAGDAEGLTSPQPVEARYLPDHEQIQNVAPESTPFLTIIDETAGMTDQHWDELHQLVCEIRKHG